jgi:hypothetical protein
MNSFTPINPALVDTPQPDGGYPADKAAEDTPDVLRDVCGSALRSFQRSWWIPANERADRARFNDENNLWGMNRLDRFTMQDPTHECTCHMLRAQAEAARNKMRGVTFGDGPKKDHRYPESTDYGSVWLSAKSIYDQVNPKTRNNPQQRGGASCRQVLEVALRTGFLPDKIQPHDYGFKHYWPGTSGRGNNNQSSGPYSSKADFPDAWEETAKLLMPKEVIITTDWEEALCLLLHGCVLGYGRNGHAVPPAGWNVASNVIPYPDSYNVIRYDSINAFRNACRSGVHCIVSFSKPADWKKPAGVLHVTAA